MATLAHVRRPTAAAPAGCRSRRSERGASLIEMSLVIGLLALFIFGIITYGLTMSYKQNLTQAANEAARAAAVAPTGTAAVRAQAAADRAISGQGTPCNDTTKGLSCTFVINPCVGDTSRRCMTVRLTYDLKNHPRVSSLPAISETLPATLVSTAVVEVN
ncbi:pilus assembly protein [soil metagenome]